MRWPFISCLGIFQGCIAVYLSRFCCFSAATCSSYHKSFALSTTFLNFFQSSFWLPAELSFPQSPLAFYQTLSCLSIPFLKNFYFVFRPLYHSVSDLYLTRNLAFFSTALTSDFGICLARRALVYNTKSCCICQQLFSKIFIFFTFFYFYNFRKNSIIFSLFSEW